MHRLIIASIALKSYPALHTMGFPETASIVVNSLVTLSEAEWRCVEDVQLVVARDVLLESAVAWDTP